MGSTANHIIVLSIMESGRTGQVADIEHVVGVAKEGGLQVLCRSEVTFTCLIVCVSDIIQLQSVAN